jgi:hypothetical protein
MLYYRCAAGHVFHLSISGRVLSLHVGSSRIGRCPVDGKWGRITIVSANELTEAEIASADSGKRG